MIFVDLDSVVFDFIGKVKRHYKQNWGSEALSTIDNIPHFFRELELLEDAYDGFNLLHNYCDSKKIPVAILTALPEPTNLLVTAGWDKLVCVRNKLHPTVPVFCSAGWKRKTHWCAKGDILVDDMLRNIEAWNAAGGIGIHHTNWNDSLTEVQQILGARHV